MKHYSSIDALRAQIEDLQSIHVKMYDVLRTEPCALATIPGETQPWKEQVRMLNAL